MQPVYLSIQQKATGERIRELLKKNGYTVKDIQKFMGFENPQVIYKWISGRSLPSIDNFLILSKVLHTSIEDILGVLPVNRTIKNNKFLYRQPNYGWRYFYATFVY